MSVPEGVEIHNVVRLGASTTAKTTSARARPRAAIGTEVMPLPPLCSQRGALRPRYGGPRSIPNTTSGCSATPWRLHPNGSAQEASLPGLAGHRVQPTHPVEHLGAVASTANGHAGDDH